MIVAGLVVVPIARRVSARVVVPVALTFSVVAYLLVPGAVGDGALALLIAAFVLLGIGIGAAETVSNELILASAPPAKAGAASAVSETAYELGAVLGTAVLGGILTAAYRTGIVLPAGSKGRRRMPRARPGRGDDGRGLARRRHRRCAARGGRTPSTRASASPR
jgi:DHA2 family multidrug resistance protein-like MFS transporter